MVGANAVTDVIDTEEVADYDVPGGTLVRQEREEVLYHALVHGVKVLNVEGVVGECHVGLEGVRKDGRPSVIAHERDLTLRDCVFASSCANG